MFLMDYEDGAWQDPRIVPYGPFSLDPAAKVLHYGQEIFEGMKAYRNPLDGSVHMFRPDMNIARFNRSCRAHVHAGRSIPTCSCTALELLIDIDRDWVPSSPNAAVHPADDDRRRSPAWA